jgi:hypothetical protein
LSAEDIQVATVLGRQAFFYMTLFDMGAGKDPDLSRGLRAARSEFLSKEAAITAALLDTPSRQSSLLSPVFSNI